MKTPDPRYCSTCGDDAVWLDDVTTEARCAFCAPFWEAAYANQYRIPDVAADLVRVLWWRQNKMRRQWARGLTGASLAEVMVVLEATPPEQWPYALDGVFGDRLYASTSRGFAGPCGPLEPTPPLMEFALHRRTA
jgi:hypothetical protein